MSEGSAVPRHVITGVAAIVTFGLLLAGARYYNTSIRPINLAKEAVRAQLNDPDSAQFKDVRVSGDDVCGLVNAKNRMGGYVGFTTFVVMNPAEPGAYTIIDGTAKAICAVDVNQS